MILAGYKQGENENKGKQHMIRNKGKLTDIQYLMEDEDEPVLDLTHICDMIFGFLIAFAVKDFFFLFWDRFSASIGIKSLVVSYFARAMFIILSYILIYNYVVECKMKNF